MLGRLFKRREGQKFNYVPRYYDRDNHDMIHNRIGDGRFAKGYLQKRKSSQPSSQTIDETKIDFSTFRTKREARQRTPQSNVVLILVGLMLIIFILWLITNPNFTDIFANG